MRIHEVIATTPHNDMKRLTMLKLMLQQGQKPEIVDAYFIKGHFSWSDLERLGYAREFSTKKAGGASDKYWKYTGPSPITLVTSVNGEEERQEMNTGDSTRPVEVMDR